MLVLLAITAKWINHFGGITGTDLIDAINSAAECLKKLVQFFDIDDHDHVSSIEGSLSDGMTTFLYLHHIFVHFLYLWDCTPVVRDS